MVPPHALGQATATKEVQVILKAATISGFKSFRKPVQVYFSERTSILIGPNDHGKTNVLLAIERLGADKEFTREDINHRISAEAAHLTYQFATSDAEIQVIESGIRPLLEQEASAETERLSRLSGTDGSDSSEAPLGGVTLKQLAAPPISPVKEWGQVSRLIGGWSSSAG